MPLNLAEQQAVIGKKKTTAADVISAQRWSIMNESPFLGVLVMHLTPVEAPYDWCTINGVPTMATEGKNLYYHPGIIDVYTGEEIKAIIMHEVLHAALRHMMRRENRDPFIWNIACDFAVNDIINEMVPVKNGKEIKYTLPKGTLYNPDFKGMSAEHIYQKLIKDEDKIKNFQTIDIHIEPDKGNKQDQNQNNQNQQRASSSSSQKSKEEKQKQRGQNSQDDLISSNNTKNNKNNKYKSHSGGNDNQDENNQQNTENNSGSGNRDNIENGVPALSREEISQLTTEWQMRTIEALTIQKKVSEMHGNGRGSLPSQLEEMIEEIRKPKTNIFNILHRFMHMAVTDYVNWNIPNIKRLQTTGFYMPKKINYMMDPVIVVDTSGSISKEDLEVIFGVIDKIIRALPVNKIRYIECDADVTRDIVINKADRSKGVYGMFPEPKLNVLGRGGTNFNPPFERILKDRKFRPSFVLYITADGDGYMPDMKRFPYRVLWLVDKDRCRDTKKFHFGTVVTYDRNFINEYSPKNKSQYDNNSHNTIKMGM